MKKSKLIIITGVLAFVAFSVAHTQEHKLTRGQEIEFNTNYASYTLPQMLKQEKAIAALPKKEVAVFAAAAGINKLTMAKKESGDFTQQQFTYITSVALTRLSILSQTANMPPAVTACHLAEARNLENISKGKPPMIQNCRMDAYGTDIQSEALKEAANPSWASTNDLVTKWVVNAFTYAESIGKISLYGAVSAPKIEPTKPRDPKESVSMMDMYRKADDRGKVAICAPALSKYVGLMTLGMRFEIEDGKQHSPDKFAFLKRIIMNGELLKASATQYSKSEYDSAWKDSANDPILLTRQGISDFSKMCFEYNESLIQKGWYSPSEKTNAENLAVKQLQEVKVGKPK